jgi:hypothetical protein
MDSHHQPPDLFLLLRWVHAYFTYRKGAGIFGEWLAPSPPNP